MIEQKEFNEIINDLLNAGSIESKPLKNVDIIKYVVNDTSINDKLYNGFIKYYESIYGDDYDYALMKVQDMLYRIHLLINYNFIERFGVVDNYVIKNAIRDLVDNETIDLYDAVSFDDSDMEFVDIQDFDVISVLLFRNI